MRYVDGSKIFLLRQELGLSRWKFCQWLEDGDGPSLSEQRLLRIEKGSNFLLSGDELYAIARISRKPMEWFYKKGGIVWTKKTVG